MDIPVFHVDAFSSVPFAGNPAVVCLLDEPLPDVLLAKIAAEMNLSETAFLMAEGEGYRLRWFTPAVEAELCGHGTLASAHVLFKRQQPVLAADAPLRFFTRSGELRARRRGDWIELDFPQRPVEAAPAPAPLLAALGVKPLFSGKSLDNFIFEVEGERSVREMRPDFFAVARYAPHGVIVTSRAETAACDFISRYFAPAVGVAEDPATGSAHCSLAVYWAPKLNKNEMTAYQASARGGWLRLRLDNGRTFISGQAVTVLSGHLPAQW